MPTIDLSERRVWGSKDRMPLGKYKGKTVGWVLKEDPGYLVWADNNIDFFNLDDEIRQKAEYGVFGQRGRNNFDDRIGENDSFDGIDDDIPF